MGVESQNEEPEVLAEQLTWADRFRRVQPGVELMTVAETIVSFARLSGTVINPESLRVQMINKNSPLNRGLRPDINELLEKVLQSLKDDPFYLDGEIRLSVKNMHQLAEWVSAESKAKEDMEWVPKLSLLSFENDESLYWRVQNLIYSKDGYTSCSKANFETLLARFSETVNRILQ